MIKLYRNSNKCAPPSIKNTPPPIRRPIQLCATGIPPEFEMRLLIFF